MKWMNLLLIFIFIFEDALYCRKKTKGIELCHFPWALVKMFITQDDILMSDWRLPSWPFLLLCWFFFLLNSLLFFLQKYHKLVWSAYRWRYFVRMQHYFLHSSLFYCVSYHMLRDTSLLWPKTEFVFCHSHWCYDKRPCFSSYKKI